MADYYSIIARAVSRLPSKTDEARHAIYQRARTAVQERLRNCDPPLSQIALANELNALDAAISKLENCSGRHLRQGTREPIARYILVFVTGTAFLAGLVALIYTQRIYRARAAPQSQIHSQPNSSILPRHETSK
jgi:hypothetical protein